MIHIWFLFIYFYYIFRFGIGDVRQGRVGLRGRQEKFYLKNDVCQKKLQWGKNIRRERRMFVECNLWSIAGDYTIGSFFSEFFFILENRMRIYMCVCVCIYLFPPLFLWNFILCHCIFWWIQCESASRQNWLAFHDAELQGYFFGKRCCEFCKRWTS